MDRREFIQAAFAAGVITTTSLTVLVDQYVTIDAGWTYVETSANVRLPANVAVGTSGYIVNNGDESIIIDGNGDEVLSFFGTHVERSLEINMHPGGIVTATKGSDKEWYIWGGLI